MSNSVGRLLVVGCWFLVLGCWLEKNPEEELPAN